jgi:phospholipid/cholesterol/gamma-HCH transport system substrate-binding protein
MPNPTPTPAPPPAADKERRATIKAGLFVLGAIAALALVMVILGNAHRVFERRTGYVVHFVDVDGLMVDSPVRLGGLSVGAVDSIQFSKSLEDTRVEVRLHVAENFSSRIRADSVARVASRGLLGDKTVDLSLGSEKGEQVPEGGELTAGMATDVAAVLKSATEVVGNVVSISGDLRKAVTLYTGPEVSQEITGALESLRAILDQAAQGPGAVHALLYDPRTGADVSALVGRASAAAARIDTMVGKVEVMLDEVKGGDGTAHALLYGPEGKKALVELGDAAAQVATLLKDVKSSKDAAVHTLVYGDSRALVDDLTAAAVNLKNITGRVDRGEGSLGALVNDPSAYEDLKTILGNVKRNRVLRALVRLTISNRGEYAHTGTPSTIPQPEEPPAAAAPAPSPASPPPAPAATR